ncbi:3-hydroxyacyl-CoA dehydrogenase family protein [Actinoplanes couchii]|uniref:3-hydroxyacyl-CoA dehydrogenase n=1 Tax=Actinoplanes couchii TaxID=403638 RepID=A0ABQ3XR57_9ACTN|nr:3-hydroxyacyl-CoA dehydrogenase family protein [Actinoplanes couchii]MDR6318189.1 3-hydroxybutyryl-CoA dehydrogenase [Actinoplanes couchii]GID60983.1 3-hydroxyacyl-CoA dehydrogenase [Actinoplanes couchii]
MLVGIFGGGRMGAGIAHAFLTSGDEVVVIETGERAAVAARERVQRYLDRSGGGHSFRTAMDPSALADCDLVVEAVPEDAALKASVLTAAEKHAPGAVLASNTSSLSIDGLAAGLDAPERFLGLHFFNPVPVSGLVEVVAGSRTGKELIEKAQGWVRALGKTAIVVRDSPGFASSRLGVHLALEAMRMLEEGVASAADIDAAMTLGYRHPTGPLRTTDLVGLDVRLAIAEHLARELGPRFEPPAVLRDLVAAGHLGRKTGKGFFDWV